MLKKSVSLSLSLSRRRISFVHWLERDVLRRLFQRIFCWSRLEEVSYWMFIAEEHFHGDIVQLISDVNTKLLFHSTARRRVQLRRVLQKFPRSQSKAEDIADLLQLDIRLSIERWRERDWHCIFENFCSEKLNRSATKKKKEMIAVSVQSFRFLCRWARRRNASRCSSNWSPPFKYDRTPSNAVERSKVCKTRLSSVIRALTAKDTAGWMLLVIVRSTRERETSVAVVLVLFLAILEVDLHLFEIEISWHEEIQLFQSIASFIDVPSRSYGTVDCSETKFNSLFFIFLALLLETFRKAWKSPNVSPVKWNWLLKEMPCREEGEEWRDSWERDRQQWSLFHRPDQRRVARRSNETIRDRSVRKPQSFLRRSDHYRTGESRLDPFEWSMPRAEILDSHNSNVLSEGDELLSVEEWSLRSRSDSDQALSVSPGDSLDRENVGPKQLPDRERTIVWRCHWSQLAFVAQTNCKDEEFVLSPYQTSEIVIEQIICRTKKKCFSSSEKKGEFDFSVGVLHRSEDVHLIVDGRIGVQWNDVVWFISWHSSDSSDFTRGCRRAWWTVSISRRSGRKTTTIARRVILLGHPIFIVEALKSLLKKNAGGTIENSG